MLTTSFPASETDFAGGFVAHSAQDLVNRGWQVRVLAPTGSWTPSGVERLSYCLPGPLARPGGIPEALEARPVRGVLSGVVATQRLWRAIRRHHRPNELIVAHWLVPCGLVATHFQSGLFAGQTGVHGIAHGGDVALLERLPGGRKLARRLDRRLSGITFVSANLKTRFEALLGTPSQCPMYVVPMGISPTQGDPPYQSQLQARAKNRKIVATVGRLVPIKGLDDLAHALVDLKNVVWLCAGDGPQQAQLTALCQRLGIARIALGGVSPAHRDALLAMADVFVLPSRPVGQRTEGTPTSLLEALAAGTPCIASNTGGIGPVAQAAGALLVNPGDRNGLKAALRMVLESPERRRAMSDAHRQVGKAYHWDAIGARHALAFANSLDGCFEFR